ncbi:hypothetical protein [Aurantiacibacter gangjinensis]|uniref:Uncharacterized protein n=1 Tax=Aurantiacibacter gangjinensis TaxID=502682 RepID=A0A0G9MR64_9SPHN|nr:hypothetical protein [Aurantiacibacter gangjinensis]APE27819.1 hypothetical protein BMF35_a0990 [Aurantiacibacter gangjinensis]KLE31803.1 hypothetical protein AAW01_09925 [Aurantiacibacter gangjinensis]
MADSTQDSDEILRAAKASLQTQRDGGYHRRSGSIGEGSRGLKRSVWAKRIRNMVIAVFTMFLAAGIAGAMFNGIGFWGVMTLLIGVILAVTIFSSFPKVKVPQRADLVRTQDARQLVARTELWLEHQRAALPAPAARILDDLGTQLDALGQQLEHVDPAHPAAGEVRKLVGEILPKTIESYTRIPAHLRREERAGSTPDAQLTRSLGKISKEVDSVTRQLAEGSLDDLAIKDRYLDYRYGDAEGMALPQPDAGRQLDEGAGVPLPDFDREKTAR